MEFQQWVDIDANIEIISAINFLDVCQTPVTNRELQEALMYYVEMYNKNLETLKSITSMIASFKNYYENKIQSKIDDYFLSK
ncbi:hypothetical protein A3Q56_02043 [Intoshia linei]|uniref:Uncharacterized protein n=1 Tax=Intoshia linei TaxID=1819745 RepID=A0A177B9N3_9BILA|nr:hypothetical protein A3Q56_02043 [Intoshia linei]